MTTKPALSLLLLIFLFGNEAFSQDSTDLLNLVGKDAPKKEYVYNTFKSSRVIMSHSVEMLRPGVLDFRILHRFGADQRGCLRIFRTGRPGHRAPRPRLWNHQ
jgi:hypothetical protein